MEFIYNKKIDIQCWQRIIDQGPYFERILDTRFPKRYNITCEMVEKAKNKAKEIQKYWNRKEQSKIESAMKKIFSRSTPDFKYYINTSPYSMDNYPEFISISIREIGLPPT